MHQIDTAPPTTYRMSFTVGEHSARHLRRIVRAYLHVWRLAELCDAAELAVTELQANVVRHVPDRRCALLVVRQAAVVRIEVTDAAPGLPARGEPGDGLAEGGRGLLLVDAVADRWGVVRHAGGGKTVWFECEAKPPSLDR
ncbi:ATP-binding protein [Streptomyces sp. NBC_00829]|uniref:ATP-binding protein n=1 Tax=Streptomyces sp. NBC_00829 TaxID=2903679 RepID=UPI0038650881|nr:ATP-binding protein [Streptomyces sp. NBC_00829]